MIHRKSPESRAARVSRLSKALTALMAVLALPLTALGMDLERKVDFNIPAQDLGAALFQFSQQARIQVIVSGDIRGEATQGVSGQRAIKQALSELLEPAGLRYQVASDDAITVAKATQIETRTSRAGHGDLALRVVQNEPTNDERSSSKEQSSNGPAGTEPSSPGRGEGKGGGQDTLAEVIVTGTHIRGVTNSASPVHVYTREDIDRTGLGTVQAFVHSLPQNFNGGASEGTISSVTGGGDSQNNIGATGVNLRGLGNDATLVLINGRRVAPANIGNFADISLIPLTAVERVEVVTDGASAIYGSDAVGGVINFILLQNFDGAETRARYGGVSEGGSRELQIGQVLGHAWGSGSAFLSYEYFDRSPLSALDRSYTETAVQPFSLLPDQVRHGAFISLKQSLNPAWDLFAEASFSNRSTYFDVSQLTLSQRTTADIDAYSSTLGTRIDTGLGTQLEISATYAANETRFKVFPSGRPLESDSKRQLTNSSVDAKLDGALGSIPAGRITFAVGAQYRTEELELRNLLARTEFSPDRNVVAGFVEVRLPIIGPSGTNSVFPRLEVSLADRHEEYSDFGSSNNPQVGVVWRLSRDAKLRATYGTSFKAPLLNDLHPLPDGVYPFPEFDPVANDFINTLVLFGGNDDLTAQKAKNWTVGFDVQPQNLPNLTASVTYYNISFRDRITTWAFAIDPTDALRNESILGPEIVQRNASQSTVQQWASTPGYQNFFGIDLATIGVIIDARTLNLSVVETSGLDLDLSYAMSRDVGDFDFGLSATYLLNFDNQITSRTPSVDYLNTQYNPVDFRARARGGFSRAPLSFTLFANYIDSYKDARVVPQEPVSSWATVDLITTYHFGRDSSAPSNPALTLSITNIADKSPPFVRNSQYGINFDGANANALGRYYAVQLSKRW